MNPSEQTEVVRLPRGLLLVFCIPMVLAHGFLSLLMIFPLFALICGDLWQAVFVIWWAVGTAGLAVLVYSAATFHHERKLTRRRVVGLLAGMVATLPLVLGFAGDWRIAVSAFLASCAAGYILLSAGQASPQEGSEER